MSVSVTSVTVQVNFVYLSKERPYVTEMDECVERHDGDAQPNTMNDIFTQTKIIHTFIYMYV